MKVGIVEFIDSMHHLPGYPGCNRPHGHTYRVEVCVEGEIKSGIVLDFGRLRDEVRTVLRDFDHINLNEVLSYPSCENLCTEIYLRLKQRLSDKKLTVRIWEGEGKWVEYSER
jgi:6-pyruvoyltetrahydropterin/6-carboxytetrahydropterin synthase